MRTVDLAVYADLLAARSAEAAARLERARARVRQALIERQAREALAPETVRRLEQLGQLASVDVAAARREVRELTDDVQALAELQAWIEGELFAAREEGYVMRE